jgi:pimeloyl-ACP methyl ester carboxylesterase
MERPAMEVVVSADTTRIACWRSGEGPPLVLVHGTAADHARWAPVLEALGEHLTVVAVDRRGRGGSGDAEEWAIEREFEDVAKVVEWTGPETILLGHSFGAVCALEAALLTDHVQRLVLYEPAFGPEVAPLDVIEALEALLAAGERDELLALFMNRVAGATPDQIQLMRATPAWEARLAAAHTIPRELRTARALAFASGRFRHCAVPTLLLQGSESPAAFKSGTRAVHEALPNARIAVLPGQRHTAMDTATELFTSEVLAFARDQESRGA